MNNGLQLWSDTPPIYKAYFREHSTQKWGSIFFPNLIQKHPDQNTNRFFVGILKKKNRLEI